MLWIMFSQYIFSKGHAQGMDVVADNNITKVATKTAPLTAKVHPAPSNPTDETSIRCTVMSVHIKGWLFGLPR